MSTTHILNFCVAKNVNFDDHLQFEANSEMPLTLTPKDHKWLFLEGVEILEGVNVGPLDAHRNSQFLGI